MVVLSWVGVTYTGEPFAEGFASEVPGAQLTKYSLVSVFAGISEKPQLRSALPVLYSPIAQNLVVPSAAARETADPAATYCPIRSRVLRVEFAGTEMVSVTELSW